MMVADQGFPQHVKSALHIYAATERAIRKRLADLLVQHARAEEDARGEADAVSEAYRHAAALANGALCNCPGVFHPVEHGA